MIDDEFEVLTERENIAKCQSTTLLLGNFGVFEQNYEKISSNSQV